MDETFTFAVHAGPLTTDERAVRALERIASALEQINMKTPYLQSTVGSPLYPNGPSQPLPSTYCGPG